MNIKILKYYGVLLSMTLISVGCESNKKKDVNEATSKAIDSNDQLQIVDISQSQLVLYNKYIETDSVQKVKVFRDSLYHPYKDLWDGLVGDVSGFDYVTRLSLSKISELNEKNRVFYSSDKDRALLNAFFKVRDGIKKLTGYSPKGKWYLLYGPSWANLGGVGEGIMFIDFAFPDNKDLNSVINWFPH